VTAVDQSAIDATKFSEVLKYLIMQASVELDSRTVSISRVQLLKTGSKFYNNKDIA